MNKYERESKELVEVVFTKNAVTTATGFKVCNLPDGERPNMEDPDQWEDPLVLDGSSYMVTGGYPPGVRAIWVFFAGADEQPVKIAGTYLLA